MTPQLGTIPEMNKASYVQAYPPFLETLADDPRIDRDAFTADAGFGGEGISESLRSSLSRRFQRVVGSYGASDLEVNMAPGMTVSGFLPSRR